MGTHVHKVCSYVHCSCRQFSLCTRDICKMHYISDLSLMLCSTGAVLRLEAQARAERIQCDLVLLRSRWILRLLAEGVKLLAMDSEGER